MKSKDVVYYLTAKSIGGNKLYWDGHGFIPYGSGCVKVYTTEHRAVMVMLNKDKLFRGSLDNFVVEKVEIFPDDDIV